MTAAHKQFPRFSPVGDHAVLIELADELSAAVNTRVHAMDGWMKENPLKGVVEWVPAFISLLTIYDPTQVELIQVKAWLQEGLENLSLDSALMKKKVIIPVYYGGQEGPDLVSVANFHQLTPQEVVRRHTAGEYRVGMMGFTPGFAYLLGLNPSLATPRLSTPRISVPTGSVGIAGGQTGVYPLESPGGWQIIGRTEINLFDPENEPHFLLSPGASVQFVAVNEDAFS